MAEEVFRSQTKDGEPVEVTLTDDGRRLTIRVGSRTVTPYWGSQEFDDWLDWIWLNQRQGNADCRLPADEPGWFKLDGYVRFADPSA